MTEFKQLENTVNLVDVSKSFFREPVLEHVTLTLEPGHIYGIIGRNGSGKSVLLKIISGLINPDSGSVRVFGKLVDKGNYAPNCGIAFDCTGFLGGETARTNLRLLADISKQVTYEEVDEWIRRVGLDPNSKQHYRHFSLGMKQKLLLSQAFMEQPRLLLLDEPMNALDEESIDDMRALIREYCDKKDAIIVLTSHNMEDIHQLCDKVYRIQKHQLIISEP